MLLRRRLKSTGSPARLALLLLFLTLLVFFIGEWIFLEIMKQSKETDLGKRLVGIGTTASAIRISGKNFLLLERNATTERFEEDPLVELETLTNELRALRARNLLRSVMIINDSGRVMLDARKKLYTGEVYPLLYLDEEEIRTAFSGEAATSPLYRVEGNPYKRCYVPLFSSGREVTAVLRLEASRDYFRELNHMKSYLTWLGILVFFLLMFVASLFYKLLKNLLLSEETLAQTDRLQSLGAMAAGLAHEIRNPLGIIRATAESIGEELPQEAEQQGLIRSIIDEADRMNQLMTRFLQFAGPTPEKDISTKCGIPGVIRSVAEMVRKELDKKSILLETDIEENLPPAAMDEKSLRQILLNLVLNSSEAVGKNGRIEIRARSRKKKILVEVADTGRGIPSKDIDRVFDPFFTTREGGTGLGLFVTRMLVERAGGTIAISSRSPRGTLVSLALKTAG